MFHEIVSKFGKVYSKLQFAVWYNADVKSCPRGRLFFVCVGGGAVAVKAMRPCARPGCSALTSGTYCQAHRPKDGGRRSTAYRAWYKSTRFRKARDQFMTANQFCARCGAWATDLDHIQPHKGDAALFWDPENWQALCASCHSRKTAAEDGGFGNAGSGAGKRGRGGW